MILITLSILSLPLTAVCYFYSRLWLCIIFALVFFASNIIFAHSILYQDHKIFFFLLLMPFVMFPVSCLIAFALDVIYGIFCIDTTFDSVCFGRYIWNILYWYNVCNISSMDIRTNNSSNKFNYFLSWILKQLKRYL